MPAALLSGNGVGVPDPVPPPPPYVDDDVEGVVVGEEDAHAAAVLHDSVVVEGQLVHRGPGSPSPRGRAGAGGGRRAPHRRAGAASVPAGAIPVGYGVG